MSADIDIDLPDRQAVLSLISHTPARQMHNGHVRRHNSGVYVTTIPTDPIMGCAAIDYEQADKRGYFKLDFLNMSVYNLVKSPEHLDELMAAEPPWERLWTDTKWAEQLVHVGGHIQLLQQMKPDSIPRMAAFISVIRPGKAHLQRRSWEEVFAQVWDGNTQDGYTFKKAHALGYAMLVKVQMNLLNQSGEQA